MTPIEDCPKCRAALQVPGEQVGTVVECPDCGHQFLAVRMNEGPATAIPVRNPEQLEESPGPEFSTPVGRKDRPGPEGKVFQGPALERELREVNTKKMAAGICGILVGGLGIHKFILGFTTSGIIMLLVSLVCGLTGCFCGIPFLGNAAMGIIGLVEGILYLTRSDEEFYRTYIIGKKEWF